MEEINDPVIKCPCDRCLWLLKPSTVTGRILYPHIECATNLAKDLQVENEQLRNRVLELEGAIFKHKDTTGGSYYATRDERLYKVLESSAPMPEKKPVKDKDYLRVIFERKEDGSYEIFEHRAFTTGFTCSTEDLRENIDDSLAAVWPEDEEDVMGVFLAGLTETGLYEVVAEIKIEVHEYGAGYGPIEYDTKTVILEHKVQKLHKEYEKVFFETDEGEWPMPEGGM